MAILAKLTLLAAAAGLLAAGAAGAAAAPGDLDQAFGDSGLFVADLDGSESALVMRQRPDGRIVVGGEQSGGTGNGYDGIVAQFNPNGGMDSSFGLGAGWSRIDPSADDGVTDLELRPDGRIVAVGRTDNDGMVARLLAVEGTLDPSFAGGQGVDDLPFGGTDAVQALALQPDGKIVVGGFTFAGPSKAVFARLLADTAGFDDTFADIGVVTEDFGSTDFQVDDIALQPDGKLVYAGNIQTNGSRNIIVGRLLMPSGEHDPSFGGGSGRTVIDLGTFDYAASLAIQPDGRIVVAGARSASPAGPGTDFAVARVLPNGLPDPTFAGGGSTAVDFGGADIADEMALQPDGRIVVLGTTTSGSGGKDDMAVARLLPNGSLDPAFGTSGRVRVDFGGFEDGTALSLLADGRILVAGSTAATADGPQDIAVARLLGGDAPAAPAAGAAPGGPAGATVLCGGRRATIVGTAGRDRIRGTRGPDVIAALGGNDVVSGLGGDDIVCGGAGADRLLGGAGRDRLIGGAGADTLLGGAGRDRLLGGAGGDKLVGGAGVDALLGGAGRNIRTP
ncbi:MAG: hypothetical protein AB7O78_04470 [Thermoleophilia bacterium]